MTLEPKDLRALLDRCEAAEQQLAQARAVAFAEAAAIARSQPYAVDTNVGARQEWVKQQIAEKIEQLAPLEPSIVCLPVETVVKVRLLLTGILGRNSRDEQALDDAFALLPVKP